MGCAIWGHPEAGVPGGPTARRGAASVPDRSPAVGAAGEGQEALTEVDLLLAAGTLGHGLGSAGLGTPLAAAVGCSTPAPPKSLPARPAPPRPAPPRCALRPTQMCTPPAAGGARPGHGPARAPKTGSRTPSSPTPPAPLAPCNRSTCTLFTLCSPTPLAPHPPLPPTQACPLCTPAPCPRLCCVGGREPRSEREL